MKHLEPRRRHGLRPNVKNETFIVNWLWLWFLLRNFAVRKKIVMVSLSFSFSYTGMIAMVVLLFGAIVILMSGFKSPMRKWICFGLSAVSVVYLLYILLWHESIGNGQRFDWYLVGIVGITASLGMAGIGFMDMVKPVALPVVAESEMTPPAPSSVENREEQQEPIVEDDQTDEDNSAEEERMRKEELIGEVMPWFLDQLVQYSDEEQAAIKVCAISFVYENVIPEPEVTINTNSLYSQSRIIEMCSAFYLLGNTKDDCVTFVKRVFSGAFANTEDSTIAKKIKGAERMLLLIDTYWEAKGINVKNQRIT